MKDNVSKVNMDIINAHKTHTFGSQVLAHTSCNSRNKFPWLQAGLCAFLFQALPDSSSAGNKFWADFLVAIVDFLCCTKSLLDINRLLSIGWGWGRWAKHHKAYFTMIKDRRINTNMYIHINLWPLNAKSWLTGKDWFWERLRAGREGGERGWDGWMAPRTQRAWVWANSGR